MPFDFEIEAGVALERWTGQLTFEAVLECVTERRADPHYLETTPRLVDLSDASGDLSSDEIRALACLHGESDYRGPCAFVAPRDFQFALGRMFVSLVGNRRPVAVFRSRESALEWLSSASATPEAH